ncbi:hypothetical protein EDI_242080 [Entamoeba dispar SAW760]|uniref:Uncharacterized protein n=1 Tax=Entamoeba dispar (strain ATCC PRA-260 / SAW760) TaxID=370354 RepID=B0EP21_ENTDS|nr:uncharacterized protein EDI_242080 [Entamoeba dispar SAW760]EDR23725.1 hypothetical protein EDI_242080 [Entamoeba dispar SAW760]|eukprot:EDR23725.1 hypothetical protein EDI_242080 [Entamoeba dispar SAW760]
MKLLKQEEDMKTHEGSLIKESRSEGLLFFRTKNEYKDFYVIQQGILLSFLNSYCLIKIKKQKKQALVTSAYPIVTQLDFGNEEIDVQELADSICRPIYEDECKLVNKKQTAMRRFEKNKKVFVQHLLIDMLTEKGFYFESKLARKTNKTFRLERIEKIYYGGRLIMNFNDFLERGYAVNSYLNSQFKDSSSAIIPKQSKGLSDLILKENLYSQPIFN